MVAFREFVQAFRDLNLNKSQPVIVHASLSAVGEIRGGAETVLGALLQSTAGVMAPTFTYRTMILPETGPEENGASYGTGYHANRMAEFYRSDMPSDPLMGILSECIRRHPDARRSMHPILSFAGIQVDHAIAAQTLEDPLAPIRVLEEQNGVVLLIGVNHTTNTSIHHAERLSGRKQFLRWALTPQGVRACPGFGGCSDGFEAAAPYLAGFTKTTSLGSTTLRAIPLVAQTHILTDLLYRDPLALLCGKNDERCAAVRRQVEQMQVLGRETTLS